jgi:hypothetical protein
VVPSPGRRKRAAVLRTFDGFDGFDGFDAEKYLLDAGVSTAGLRNLRNRLLPIQPKQADRS